MTHRTWTLPFLDSTFNPTLPQEVPNGFRESPWALIILNQPFHRNLFERLWHFCNWRGFADGGSNHVYDVVHDDWQSFRPDVIAGDMDSIRPEVRAMYEEAGVPVIEDKDMFATDMMKCFKALEKAEQAASEEFSLILLGGLTGRLDQTVHTLSFVYKLRKQRKQVFAVSDENIGWVLDQGEHIINLDRTHLGQTCGLLPIGIDSTVLSMRGLEWNWTDHESSFEGDISTSNWLASDEVWIKTSRPIWWTIQLKGIPKP